MLHQYADDRGHRLPSRIVANLEDQVPLTLAPVAGKLLARQLLYLREIEVRDLVRQCRAKSYRTKPLAGG